LVHERVCHSSADRYYAGRIQVRRSLNDGQIFGGDANDIFGQRHRSLKLL
jgi:hypothetical protein